LTTLDHLLRQEFGLPWIDAKSTFTGQRFATKFEQESVGI
jgi:hypothetical protein